MVSNSGIFSGPDIHYIYAKSPFAIKGTFDGNFNLIEGQKVRIIGKTCNDFGMMLFEYSDPYEAESIYHFKPPTNISFGDQPLLADELAIEYVEIKKSKLHMDGVFAIKDIPMVRILYQCTINK